MEPSAHSSPAVSILIVDDDRVTREVTGLMVTRKFPHNTVYIADGGRTGLELFKRHRPEIVITDIQMPGMDGIEMVGEIRAIKADSKFIVLTAYGSTIFNEKFAAIGCHNFLQKPIEFDRLFALIDKCSIELALERQ